MSFDDIEPWDNKYDSQEESDSSGSPVDDIEGDPTFTYKGQVTPQNRNTRHITRIADFRLSPTNPGTSREVVDPVRTQDKANMTSHTNGKVGEEGEEAPPANEYETVAEKLTYALETMTDSFKALCDQSKQNNKSFINDLPFFGIMKEADSKKNIIPLNE